jgi:RHH-type proline utilization regulon transcriptional repressor/proline dehydrogenase/delta 1-pyrroline-5-carboxylate dehydrogenase
MLFERFKNSVRRMSTVSSEPRNKQDRGEEANQLNVEPLCLEFADFKNDHRTNFSLSQNRDWIDGVLERFSGDIHYSVPVKIGGEAVDEDRNLSVVRDRFDVNKRIGEVAIPTRKDIDDMADKAKNDELSKGWATLEQEKVFGIMAKVKAILNQRRGELIGLLASECGKSVVSAEAEICELIDFIGVYAIGAKQTEGYDNVEALNDPKLVGVISPFNFPLAILGGGIVAALMAGNSVIAKPSPKARLIASVLVDIFHAADVPKSVLQLCCAEDEDVPHFVKDLDQCIMTGGTEVALKIRKMNPDMEFFAETGGKNIMYISEFADKEAAIKKVANMSFNGQVCSAPTIIAVPRKLYKDKQFLAQLADAFSSMKVGSPLDPSTKIGPLISNMNQRLLSAYSRPNKKGWLVEPKKIDGRDDMISPGLYIGIPRSEAPKLPETFGPIVDIVCVENVDDYIALVRETGYGLTAGIQTLNPEEIQKFRDKIHAGVLYINEKMTGAEAGRNGYGGFALSRVGKGRQAGWFNYPKNFKRFKNVKPEKAAVKEWYEPRQGDNPKFAQLLQVWGGIVGHNDKIEAEAHLSEADITSLDHVLNNYILKFRDYFGVDEECPDKVLGKRIVHRFKPLGSACIIVDAEVEFNSVMLSMAASYLAGNTTEIYFRNDSLPEPQKRMIALVAHKLGIKIVPGIENDKKYTMMRVLNKADGDALSRHYASAKMHIQVESGESLYEPELEIARYMQEQSEVHAYHRYGDKLRPEDKVIMAGL